MRLMFRRIDGARVLMGCRPEFHLLYNSTCACLLCSEGCTQVFLVVTDLVLMRLQEAFPDGKDALPGLFSARFDGGPTEHKFRRVYEILKALTFLKMSMSILLPVVFLRDVSMGSVHKISSDKPGRRTTFPS